jgi:LuxR family transcriptional regulator, activator of conjugal transfer of Ti plasmids
MTATHVVQEFMDAVHTASDEIAFAGAASRLGEALGFRWLTYLSVDAGRPDVISTYPAIWSDHYLSSGYDQVDPVVAASRRQTIPFFWGALDRRMRPLSACSMTQRASGSYRV